jgi:tubulin monoglycylase TTLL3/8
VFRKKHKLTPETKIFIVVGGYSTLKKALLERGWFENPDRNSPVFDLKFAIKQSEVCNNEIQDFQIVNHFLKNNLITTKVGISKSLKNLVWWNEVDINSFFPKCFDLTDGEETDDFKNEYRFVKVS